MIRATSGTAGQQLDQIQRRLGLSDEELAAAFRVPPPAIMSWTRHDAMPDRAARQRLELLTALDRHLHESIKPESVAKWLRTRPQYLGGATPAEVIVSGDFDRIEGLLTIVDHGMLA